MLILKLILALLFMPQDVVNIYNQVPAAAGGGSAPTYENSNTAEFAGGTTVLNMTACTCTGSNKWMRIDVMANIETDESVTAATYAGSSIASSLIDGGFRNYLNVFTLSVVNPTSAGAVSVTVTASGGAKIMITSCYNGVNQTTPYRTATTGSGAANPASLSVTNSQTNDLIVGFFGLDDTSSTDGMTSARVGAGQTYRNTITNSTSEAAGSLSDEPGASGTVTHSWDFVDNGNNGWIGIALPLVPAS